MIYQVRRRVGSRWIEEPGATMTSRTMADQIVGLRKMQYGGSWGVATLDLDEIQAEFARIEGEK